MQKLKIKSITPLQNKSHVYDLSVNDTHNFFIGDNILTHNCDRISPEGQDALKATMEEYTSSARFILTTNHPRKLIPPIHSRCQGFHFDKIDHTEFTARAATILVSEGIEFDLNTLDSFVKATYPDLRKCTNLIQQHSITGTLVLPEVSSSLDWKIGVVELFKKGKIREARDVICREATEGDINELFTWAYSNLNLWADTPRGQDIAIIAICKHATNVPFIADQEINVSAMLVELSDIRTQEKAA